MESSMPASVHNRNDDRNNNSSAAYSDSDSIYSESFYGCYYGHPISQLNTLCERLRAGGCTSRIFLVGDSSLDNKYWFGEGWGDACNGYERILAPPRMKQGYWINIQRTLHIKLYIEKERNIKNKTRKTKTKTKQTITPKTPKVKIEKKK